MKNIQNKYYNKLLKKFRSGPKIVGWGSKKSQETRFNSLINNIDISKKNSMLDVGCGKGDMLNFIRNKKIRTIKYSGLDLNKNFINIAKKKYKRNKFYCGDFLKLDIKKYDIIFISGLLNLKVNNHENFLKRILKKGILKSKKKFIFNIMSSYSPFKEKKFYYSDPLVLSNFLKTITSQFIVDHTYFKHDFTVIIHK